MSERDSEETREENRLFACFESKSKELIYGYPKANASRKRIVISHTSISKEYIRGKKRAIYIASISNIPTDISKWIDLKTVIIIKRTRIIKEKTTIYQTFYLSNLEITPQAFEQYTRKYWGVENDLHWQLDVTFREYHTKVKNEIAIVNLHQVRK